ncbi:P-loop containing nucleoside triphosphate hydrolase protein, partial [Aspergillus similis]
EVGIYRARTSRRNVAYRVFRPLLPRGVPREPHQWLARSEVLGFIRQRIRQARDGRVIVYANIKSQVDAISRELGCEPYHSAVLDRTGVMQRFQSGQTRVIAATSALGMGIDIPDIRCVIHLGRPRTLLDYGQESGRAGRDGQASEAIIIHPQGWDDLDPWIDQVSDEDFERVQTYMEVVEGVGCRRYVLDQYLDGTVNGYTRQQCQDVDPDELLCDACNPDWQEDHSSPTPLASSAPASEPQTSESDIEMSDLPANPPMTIAAPGMPVERADARARSRSYDSEASILSQVPRSVTELQPASPPMPQAVPAAIPAPRVPPTQYVRAAIRQQEATVQVGIDRDFIEQEARRWLNQCYICTVAGRDGDHELYCCRHPDSQAAKKWLVQVGLCTGLKRPQPRPHQTGPRGLWS